MERVTSVEFFSGLRWIDGTPLVIEPYRARIFTAGLDTFGADGRARYNLVLCGRAKKNWKSTDLMLAALYCLMHSDAEAPCYVLANDEDQAGDDLSLAKKMIAANPDLAHSLKVHKKEIVRRDGRGFLQILPAGDVAGSHGKTARFIGWDEIHGYKSWDILEALQPDPTRTDYLWWVTSYASLYHRPGVPLYDLMATGRAGRDPRMLFSWYAADYCTDPAFAELDTESRANPSRASWADQGYLEQQRSRLPMHKYRRLHLNLPGLPEGSAFTVEAIEAAFDRGCTSLEPMSGTRYAAFVDMSGGSNDDATLTIGFQDGEDYRVARIMNQGQPTPFNPRRAIEDRFVPELRRYGISEVSGDQYAGLTFPQDFEACGIKYRVIEESATELYEAFEVPLNAGRVVLPNVPTLEQQLLGLIWKGAKITHPDREHDDWAVGAAGVVHVLRQPPKRKMLEHEGNIERARLAQQTTDQQRGIREVIRTIEGTRVVFRVFPDGREVMDRIAVGDEVKALHHGFKTCDTCKEEWLDVGDGHTCRKPWTDADLRQHGIAIPLAGDPPCDPQALYRGTQLTPW